MNKTILSLLLIFLSALSTAQDWEVVVTGTRTSLPDPGLPVIRLDKEDLVKRPGMTLSEILAALPGLAMRNLIGNPGSEEPSSFGYGENSQGRILILVDGAVVNPPDMGTLNWQMIPLSRLQSVSFLRSGASVIYGDKAVAGVIDLRTLRPASRPALRAGGSYGTFGRHHQDAQIQGAWGPLSVLAQVSQESSDGFRQRSAYRIWNAGLSAGYDAPGWQVRSSGAFSWNTYQMPGSLTKAQFDQGSLAAANLNDEARQDLIAARLFIDRQTDPARVYLQASYDRNHTSADTVSYGSFSEKTLDTASLSVLAEPFWESLPELSLPVGLDGRYDRLNLQTFSGKDRTNQNNATTVQQVDGAFFVQPSWSAEAWTLKAGSRLDWLWRAAGSTIGSIDGASQVLNATPFQASIHLKASRELGFSADYQGLFHFPLVDEQVTYYGFGTDQFNKDLGPEKGHSFSALVEYRPAEGLSLSAHSRLQWVWNEIAFNSQTFRNENLADPVRRLGAQILASWKSRLLESRLDLGWTDARMISGPFNGKFIPLVSEWQGGWEGIFQPMDGLSLSAGVQYRGPAFKGGDAANSQPQVEGYFTAQAGIEYRIGPLSLYARGKNLFDARYPAGVYYSPFSESWYPAAGREGLLGATLSF